MRVQRYDSVQRLETNGYLSSHLSDVWCYSLVWHRNWAYLWWKPCSSDQSCLRSNRHRMCPRHHLLRLGPEDAVYVVAAGEEQDIVVVAVVELVTDTVAAFEQVADAVVAEDLRDTAVAEEVLDVAVAEEALYVVDAEEVTVA